MNCENCGAALNDDSEVCDFCGTLNDTDFSKHFTARDAPVIPAPQRRGEGEVRGRRTAEDDARESERTRTYTEHWRRRIERAQTVKRVIIVVCSVSLLWWTAHAIPRFISDGSMGPGKNHLKRGVFTMAFKCFQDAVNFDSSNEEAWFGLGQIYTIDCVAAIDHDEPPSPEKMKKAEDALERALRLEPVFPQAWYYTAVLRFVQDRPNEARAALTRAIEQVDTARRRGRECDESWRSGATALQEALANATPSRIHLHCRDYPDIWTRDVRYDSPRKGYPMVTVIVGF